MSSSAPPVIRCPRAHCGGWIERRALHTQELPTEAFTCSHCSLDIEIIAGKAVAVTRRTVAPLPTVRLPLPPVPSAVRGRPRKGSA